jgi:CheY-like chemotaxis protein
MMPYVDGWAVLSRLKADPELSAIPVIMVSMMRDQRLGFALGAADYITKPVEWSRLKAVLDRYRSPSAPGRALIVESDAAIRAELRKLIEAEGWPVEEAPDAETARRRLAEPPPALILIDLQMPGLDSLAFLRQARQGAGWRPVPVVAVTDGAVSEAERQRVEGNVHRILQTGDDSSEEELVAELRRIAGSTRPRHGDAANTPGP